MSIRRETLREDLFDRQLCAAARGSAMGDLASLQHDEMAQHSDTNATHPPGTEAEAAPPALGSLPAGKLALVLMQSVRATCQSACMPEHTFVCRTRFCQRTSTQLRVFFSAGGGVFGGRFVRNRRWLACLGSSAVRLYPHWHASTLLRCQSRVGFANYSLL